MLQHLKSSLYALPIIFNSVAANADNFLFNGVTIQPSLEGEPLQEEQQTILVDRHVVFVLDQSGSMDNRESEIIYEGLSQAFNDDVFNLALNSGNRYAFTFVFFADESYTSESYVVNNPTDARIILNEVLLNDENEYKHYDVGSGTQMLSTITTLSSLFRNEGDHGFNSLSRAVVFIGDETPSDHQLVQDLLPGLQTNQQATLFCIPIVNSSFQASQATRTHVFYRGHLRTPEGRFKYINQYGFQEAVPPGFCAFARNADEARPTFVAALRPVAG
jgi:hypothetical protein